MKLNSWKCTASCGGRGPRPSGLAVRSLRSGGGSNSAASRSPAGHGSGDSAQSDVGLGSKAFSRATSSGAAGPPGRDSVVAGTAAPDKAASETNKRSSSNGSSHPIYSRDGTGVVHGGERGGRPSVRDSLTTPIVQTSTYWFNNTRELIEYNEGRFESYEYGRYGNPTVQTVEAKIRDLEGAEDCLVSASGMNSVTSMLLALVPANGHIVTTSDCYWRTRQFMINFLPKMNVGLTILPPNDLAGLKKALDENEASLFFSESPTNPYLRCVDIPAIVDLCHAKGCAVCIDSTFATPINSKALELGADLVLHSGTKYLAGHNDVLAGALCGKKELVQTVRKFHHIMGGVVDPNAAYLLLRGMKTLELRVQRQNATGMEIARRLESHPKIDRVWYPGLESHPDHAIAKRQMTGFGGVVSFEVRGDLWNCAKFIDNVKIPYIGPSLGGVESLIEMPAVQSYWSFGPEKRAEIGIKENLIRFAIGIEDVEDVWEDLVQALEFAE